MSSTTHISEVGQDNFDLEVVQKSKDLPVLVDFWAPWCGPCQVLTPILHTLAQESEGTFVLATINIDVHPRLALDHGIRSIPTVKLFRNGECVEELFGLQPESVIRALLDRHIERASDRLAAAAETAWQRGDQDRTLVSLGEALAADPQNERLPPKLARLLIELGQYDRAEEVLKRLPIARQHDPDLAVLAAQIKFGRIAEAAPQREALVQAVDANPDDCEARYRLSAIQVLRENFEPALANLLEIIKRDRSFRDDAGRKAILDVFTLLGEQAPLVKHYRSLLARALH